MLTFRYQEDILPICIFVSYFALDLGVFFLVEDVRIVFLWMLLGLFPKTMICAWNHHHQHVPTFTAPLLNRLLETIYAFQTGVSSNAWMLHHVLGHHQHYLDQEQDESRWKDAQGRKMGVIRYSLITTLTAYPRCYQVGKRFPQHQKTFLGMGSITLALLAFFFYWNWVNATLVFLLPMAISLYNTVWHTYYHHSGLETDQDFEASYNILEKWYNVATGNLGYHTAHHTNMGLHWSRLPQYHERIQEKIPLQLYRHPPIPFKWLVKVDAYPYPLDSASARL
jgi:fatty acid desaturase